MHNRVLVLALLVRLGTDAVSSQQPCTEDVRDPVDNNDHEETFVISATFGKSFPYSPASNEAFHWDGNLRIEQGQLLWIDKLLYAPTDWAKGWSGCSREYAHRLQKPEWKSEILPGSGNGTEGIRFAVKGDASTHVVLTTTAKTVSFQLGELIEKEALEFHCGAYYSGQPMMVFLGQDPRIRVTRTSYRAGLRKGNLAGGIIVPDDFAGPKAHFLSTYCAAIPASGHSTAQFDILNFGSLTGDRCIVHAQMMAANGPTDSLDVMDDWINFQVSVNDFRTSVRYFFSKFRMVQKMEDIYVSVPRSSLRETDNRIVLQNHDPRYVLLVHRVFVNDPPPSHKENLRRLPSLPARPTFWIGYDENTLSPQNGEVDSLLTMMGEEEIGNYILLRLEESHKVGTARDYHRWCDIITRYGMKAGLVGTPGPNDPIDVILRGRLGANYLGIHWHEASNLIYGWGDAEPLAQRANRTLPECEASYMRRLTGVQILGQALPITHLDYKAGVRQVFSEPPTGHTTLMFASQRGAVHAFDRGLWGVHNANHIPRMPADRATERRNFILLWQAWLYGARLMYDEEFALYALHDAPRAFSDPFTARRRIQMQELYHYASTIDLGKEDVRIGFLQGKYDCLVGGLQSGPDVPRTKVWGMIGPEKPSWEFDTPERGWELLGSFMPGVWLYPVLQDPKTIRQFFGGSPYGQVDLVPIDAPVEKLTKYQLLVLPGWNTMTDESYGRLIAYVHQGGHLVLSAAQCTRHITRDFLIEKRDFQWFADGDLTALGGIRIDGVGDPIRGITWFDGSLCSGQGVPGLNVTLTTAHPLATDQSGRPVLVENEIGRGNVWMLTVGEFWGAESLDAFRTLMAEKLTSGLSTPLQITGETRDVDWHVYSCPGGWERIVFLNTDWTSEGNVKSVVLKAHGLNIPVDVMEGRIVQILLNDGTALMFTTPGTSVTPQVSAAGNPRVRIGGVGTATLHLLGRKKIAVVNVDGRVTAMTPGGKLVVEFGEHWKELPLEVILR